MPEEIRASNLTHGKTYLPCFLLLLPVPQPFTLKSKWNWCYSGCNAWMFPDHTILCSCQCSNTHEATAISQNHSKIFFFFFRKIDKQNHCAVFSGGHCAWRTSFYNSTGCQTLHIKIATEYGVSFLASTSYHASFKCCSGNLEPWILLSRTQTMFINCSMCQLCLYANWEYMVLNLCVQLSWLGRLHFENYFEITE